MQKMRRIVMLTGSYPPILNAACNRPFYFSKYLPDFGFQPIVVTRRPMRGELIDGSRLSDLSESVIVEYAQKNPIDRRSRLRKRFASLDRVERVCGLPSNYLADTLSWQMARWMPTNRDRLQWGKALLRKGKKVIHDHAPDFIWATGPNFSSTVLVGATLSKRTGVPLIADYRDPWTYGLLWRPSSDRVASSMLAEENVVLSQATAVVFASPLIEQRMAERYPSFASKFHTITNGFDDWQPPSVSDGEQEDRRRMTASYVGTLKHGRHEGHFLDAMYYIQKHHPEVAKHLSVLLVGPVDRLLEARKLPDFVELVGPVSYASSRQYMAESDVLLLLQPIAGDGADVISGKTFDYLASRKPILAVVNNEGGDSWLLRQSGVSVMSDFRSTEEIVDGLLSLWQEWQKGSLRAHSDEEFLARFHRRSLTNDLANILDGTGSNDAPAYEAPSSG